MFLLLKLLMDTGPGKLVIIMVKVDIRSCYSCKGTVHVTSFYGADKNNHLAHQCGIARCCTLGSAIGCLHACPSSYTKYTFPTFFHPMDNLASGENAEVEVAWWCS